MWNPDEITPIGKTYAQIDEKKGKEVKEANEILKSASSSDARWWNYIVSHSNFELLVGDPLGEKNIVLFISACSYIAGPVSWSNQRLRIKWHNNPPSKERAWSFTIVDKTVGFKAEAKGFSWASNYNLLDREENNPNDYHG